MNEALKTEFTLEEAIEVATRNADSYKDIPSVSRTLLAHIQNVQQQAYLMQGERDRLQLRAAHLEGVVSRQQARITELEAELLTLSPTVVDDGGAGSGTASG